MNILFKIFLGLAALIIIILIAALFTKKDYSLEKEITINKQKQDVFNYIRFVKNQAEYSVWVMRDPNSKKTYNGTDGAPGFIYAWDGNKEVGKGEQQIQAVEKGEKVSFELRFIKPFEGKAQSDMIAKAVADNQTQVKWSFKSSMNYPMNIMLLFMDMDKFIGKDLQASLDNLKQTLEK